MASANRDPDGAPLSRPLIAIPLRFTESASALRYRGEVASRKLVEAVWAAGGEPLMMHPVSTSSTNEVSERLRWADGVLLPGGGDLSGRWSQQPDHEALYDVDELQDGFDLAIARHCLQTGLPLLAICRGQQVVNVALGGTLNQDMSSSAAFGADHRHHLHPVTIEPDTILAATLGATTTASCYHHQCLATLGAGLTPTAYAADGAVEAVEAPAAPGWFMGVQWHPEDTWEEDPDQLRLFVALVEAARGNR